MENSNNKIQVLTSSNVPANITSVDSLVQIRLDKKRFPRYRDIPMGTRQNWLAKEFLLIAKIVKAKDVDKDYPLVFAMTVDEQICGSEYASDLTLPEIEYAFKNGVFGAYGDYYGLNAVSLYGFLESFLRSEKKVESARLIREAREREIRDEDEAYRERIRAEMEEAKRNGTFVPTGRFDFGKAGKSVNRALDTREHRERIAQQAREILSGRTKV